MALRPIELKVNLSSHPGKRGPRPVDSRLRRNDAHAAMFRRAKRGVSPGSSSGDPPEAERDSSPVTGTPTPSNLVHLC